MITTDSTRIIKGGEFLITTPDNDSSTSFTPEQLTDEQRAMGEMAGDFLAQYIWPNIQRLDKQEPGLTVSLLDKAAELGLLSAAIPEEYGGLGVDIITETVLTEMLGASHSFGVSLAAHTGIGTLPVLYFGTEEQRQKYLPKLGTGEIKAAYCLTEPGSGSDSLAARTRATLSADGTHYLLEGQKMWITNAGFADLFTVFAKIDGDKFTAFLVDGNAENLRLGNEEDKMGIKGSSTRQVFLEGVKVPVENLLGEIGKGHKIAFNVLNIGRYKLGVMVCGGARKACELSVKYANERIQFKIPIAKFGAIKHKLAEQALRIWILESTNYHIAGLLHNKIEACKKEGKTDMEAKLIAAEEYAIECSIAKVFGSEVLDYVVDECVQIHGGNGFSEEYNAARAYRDSRINRIFEGTNEINRLLIFDMLIRRAMNGTLDLMSAAMAVQKDLMSIPDFAEDDTDDLLAADKKALYQAKKAALLVAGAALQKYMQKIEKEQEIIMCIADMIIDLFNIESAIKRTEYLIGLRGAEACSDFIDMTKVYTSDAMERINLNGKHAICGFTEEGDEQRMMLMGIRRYTKYPAYNTIAARRRIAQRLIDANGYAF